LLYSIPLLKLWQLALARLVQRMLQAELPALLSIFRVGQMWLSLIG
jgi:hypothetical protein